MINQIQQQLKQDTLNETILTENDAILYKTTGKELLDFSFKVASYRSKNDAEIINDFTKAWVEDPELAFKFLFFARDIREGLGERRLFRVLFNAVCDNDDVIKNMKHIGHYGRWDDVVYIFQNNYGKAKEAAFNCIKEQIEKDLKDVNTNKNANISLLGKWMPSINTSSNISRTTAKELAVKLDWENSYYRKTLSKLRKHLDVLERKLSANKWDEVDYNTVPSMANVKYNKAFMKHDAKRREAYFDMLKKGEAKINSSVVFPHDIVHMYSYNMHNNNNNRVDNAAEAMWKAQKEYVLSDTLVVADGSGSMMVSIGDGTTTALEVANSIAIYCSEHNRSDFKNKYIAFSNKPQFVDFSSAKTLLDKLRIARAYNEAANTNIKAVFDLILKTAVNNQIPEEEMVKNILIISDMEFDQGTSDMPLMSEIAKKYEEEGYQLPRLIFWNVNSRTGAIPMQKNDKGCVLVSGFSLNILQMILGGKLDPYESLKDILMSDRYTQVTLENTITQ